MLITAMTFTKFSWLCPQFIVMFENGWVAGDIVHLG